MRRIAIALLGLLLPLGMIVLVPAPASADTTPRCVTKTEYQRVYRGTSQARVRQVFGMPGALIAQRSTGYWDERFIEDGYWVADGYWDEWLQEYVDTSYWEDTSYWQPYWVRETDMVRSYPKCRNWGGGRLAVWFDNYTSNASGMRVWTKRSNKPYVLRSQMITWWNFWNARTGPMSNGK